jgi:hypothetical protein
VTILLREIVTMTIVTTRDGDEANKKHKKAIGSGEKRMTTVPMSGMIVDASGAKAQEEKKHEPETAIAMECLPPG